MAVANLGEICGHAQRQVRLVTGVRSAIPARTLPAGPVPTGRAAGIALIRDRGGAGLLTTSYAAGSAPVIAHRSAEPAIGREKRITVGQQLATYICLRL